MSTVIRGAEEEDVPSLAVMNGRLVEDQGSENTWSPEEYEQRFTKWLETDEWQVDVILLEDDVIGYAVCQLRGDYYNPQKPVIYVRHYYIDRSHRGQGLGKVAFRKLIDERFPSRYEAIELDVIAENEGGMKFWSSLGFGPYFTCMKLEMPDSAR